jgi:hypothetical protein
MRRCDGYREGKGCRSAGDPIFSAAMSAGCQIDAVRHRAEMALFLRTAIALQNELIKFLCLLRDAVRNPLLALASGCCRRLLNKLPEVVSQDRNAIVEFRKR